MSRSKFTVEKQNFNKNENVIFIFIKLQYIYTQTLNILFLRYNVGSGNKSSVHLAVVMPHSFFNGKEYQKKMYAAANSFSRLAFQVLKRCGQEKYFHTKIGKIFHS